MRRLLSTILIITVGIFSVPVPTQAALEDDLLSCWSLDEASGTREDVTATGNDLTDNNTVTSATGIVGDAASFDGDNSEYLSISDATQTGLDFGGGWWNVSFWVKLSSSTALMSPMSKYEGNNPGGILIRMDADRIIVNVARNGTTDSFSHNWSTSLNTGQWYHIFYRNDINNGHDDLFLDGENEGFTDPPFLNNGIGNNTTDFVLGIRSDSLTNPFYGEIDEFAIWTDRQVTDDEVAELYNSGNGIGCEEIAGLSAAGGTTPPPVIWFD